MRWFGLSTAFWASALALLASSGAAFWFIQDWELWQFAIVFGVQMLVFGAAARLLLKGRLHAPGRERPALITILVVAALMRVIALPSPQALSTDAYRYVWDGRVQAAGINPYRYVPKDEALAAVRDDTIYPNINRADYAHTIYPPAAQLAFLGVTRFGGGILGMKLGMLGFETLTIACLVSLLRSRGLPTSRVLLYAWHPLPVWEFAGTGHVDAIAIALLLVSFVAASRRAPVWTGVALAAATLVKYYPVAAGPALYRRWDWRMPVAFLATLVILYLPYLSVGSSVLGFLSGYASEEGLRAGDGIFLWSALQSMLPLPPDALRYFGPFAAIVMIAAGLYVQFSKRAGGGDVMRGTVLLAGLFTLLASPHDPWYFTWLIPFLCFGISLAQLWLTGACILMYVLPQPTQLAAQSLIYVPFLLLLLAEYLAARRSRLLENPHDHRIHDPSRA